MDLKEKQIKSTRLHKLLCWIIYGHSHKPNGVDVWGCEFCEYCGKTLFNNRQS